MFAKGSAQWGSVTVRMLTANRTNIPICDSEKSPLRWHSDSKNNPNTKVLHPGRKNLSTLSDAKSDVCNPVYPLDKKQSAPTDLAAVLIVCICISSYPPLHHYGSLVIVYAVFVMCKCSCSSSSCHQHPQGALCLLCWRHDCFLDKPSQWRRCFPGPIHWTTTSVFSHFLYRENVHNMSVSSEREISFRRDCQSICTPEVPWELDNLNIVFI